MRRPRQCAIKKIGVLRYKFIRGFILTIHCTTVTEAFEILLCSLPLLVIRASYEFS